MTFSINCWIFGDDIQTVFDVDIPEEDRDIKYLKRLIHDARAPRLNDVSAPELELWHVDIPSDDSEQLRRWLPLTEPLLPFRKLEFLKNGGKDHIHVIVNKPVEWLDLNCYIIGDDSVFAVNLKKTNTVNFLKDLIKEKKRALVKDSDASYLNLWKVDFPIDDYSSIEPPTTKTLSNVAPLSTLFSRVLQRELIHVVVQVPGPVRRQARQNIIEKRDSVALLDQTFRRTCQEILSAVAPSASAKSAAYWKSQIAYSVYDGRYKNDAPRSTVAPPIQLFHPAFGDFLNNIRCTPDGNIPKEVIRDTTEYMQAASATYQDERTRRMKLTPILKRVLNANIQGIENNDRTKADGTVEGIKDQNGFLLALKEDKNEFGAGGSDPTTQAGLSAARSWAQLNFESFRGATACPTFLMGNAGPWFAVLGFAFTDRVIIQRLTDFIWVGLDSALSRSHVNRVSGIFYALRTGLSSLQTYYMNLDINSEELASARFFPSITTYPGKDGRQDVKFKYVGYLENGLDCVTLHAQTETEPAQDIVVKFVERYSERAHHILAEMDMAPRLVHYGPLQPSNGSLCMVVMEYVHGDTFAVAKSKMDGEMVKTVKSEVRRALTLLHEHGLVFGDLRPPNVMITKEKTVQLIDFDWAGEAGQVEYPHLLSPAVTWPKGIRPLDPIEKEHDLEMWEGL